MVNLSKQAEYAIEFLIRLSHVPSGEVLSVRSFSTESTISFLFLQRIARSLKHAGLIHATKGANGGYTLARPFATITMLDVLIAVGDQPAIVPCMEETTSCTQDTDCTIKPGMKKMQEQMLHMLKTTTLEHLTV